MLNPPPTEKNTCQGHILFGLPMQKQKYPENDNGSIYSLMPIYFIGHGSTMDKKYVDIVRDSPIPLKNVFFFKLANLMLSPSPLKLYSSHPLIMKECIDQYLRTILAT